MDTSELIHELEKLTIAERILVIEKTLRTIRAQEVQSRMRLAADNLLNDYSTDGELTAFTSLDADDLERTLQYGRLDGQASTKFG